MSIRPFCVYLTRYSGDLLPPLYVGSSTCERISDGYHGSVRSKQYRNIYEAELKDNPDRFQTSIIYTAKTQKEAIRLEAKLQKQFNVIHSDKFFNLAVATINGFFGANKEPWNKGKKFKYKKRTPATWTQTDEYRKTMSNAVSGEKNPMHGRTHSVETQKKMEDAWKKRKTVQCTYCDFKTKNIGNLNRWHNDNCKKRPTSHKTDQGE